MKYVIRLVLLAGLIASGIWLWGMLFPRPEKVIRHQLAKLAADVSFSQSEGNLSRLARVENVADFFSSNVEVNIDMPGREQHSFAGRDEITQAALGTRQAVASLRVKFPDIDVSLAPDKQSAMADSTVEVSISSDPDPLVQELKISFQKTEGNWLIDKIETVRTLSNPSQR